MQLDVVDLLEFYRSPLGKIAAPLLQARIASFWKNTEHDRVLGIGFPTPYLDVFTKNSERTIAFMPGRQGIFAWPRDTDRLAALVDEEALPLPDSSIDRLLMVHALEMMGDPHAALLEAWRVLAPGGKILIIVPSRRGLWARIDTSPFGYGRPFSRGQIQKLLRGAVFSPEKWDGALHFPPSNARLILKSANSWESLGRRFWPAFSGVLMVEATKQLYQGIPVAKPAWSKQAIRPVLVPVSRV
ncbi:MAG: methyltransferase domain-containing protein [Rhizobiales bacterium]|nr:methyltransferase domain-containing protein [Hyphomicrobiales bacterium]